MPPPPALLEELLEEIFLRLPPDQPACLVRASLASKLWLGILTGARFRDLYRERHGSPPMLGFIYSGDSGHFREEEEGNLPYFVATTKFGMRIPAVEDWRGWHKDYTAWDCRHGRVLLADTNIFTMPLVVWDPMTRPRTTTAAGPRCSAASTGCDHRACHLGPSRSPSLASTALTRAALRRHTCPCRRWSSGGGASRALSILARSMPS
ncbi:hypothetical protein QYE76_059989 [Lolium multiflorum]|uniref:F-box domain-containing protein n=1 Tax=Lolium multiflorum TaxID=4521 RepID=A0AAD8W5U2_LOLMU|nr:hypothetical protein QYE76_059989 [Lolium multiflorum]